MKPMNGCIPGSHSNIFSVELKTVDKREISRPPTPTKKKSRKMNKTSIVVWYFHSPIQGVSLFHYSLTFHGIVFTALGLKEVPTVHHATTASALILFLESTNLTQLFVWDSSAQEEAPTSTAGDNLEGPTRSGFSTFRSASAPTAEQP